MPAPFYSNTERALDGDLCALGSDGVPTFSRLQAAMDEDWTVAYERIWPRRAAWRPLQVSVLSVSKPSLRNSVSTCRYLATRRVKKLSRQIASHTY